MTDPLHRYLARLGLAAEVGPTLDTLTALHRAHALRVPYENLDVQLQRPLSTDTGAALAKVASGRGGWCYEMNGSLGTALSALGFEVTRMAGGVQRATLGDQALGNHLVLKVMVGDEPWLCDVGFGDGLIEPMPLAEGACAQGVLAFRLERLGDGLWRFHGDPKTGGAPSFDFADAPADEDLLARQCALLQSAPESPFVLNAVVQQHRPDAHLAFRGRVLRTVSAAGIAERTVASPNEYAAVLAAEFGLDLPDAALLWPRIAARHEALFG
ncbi:MAG: arylamine N-acetyltransferase family protein [Pseudomonadota bacterium]